MGKYKETYCEILPKMFENGQSVSEVCKLLGTSRISFYNWVKKYPEFKAAFEEGKSLSEAWWMKLGRDGAAGKRAIVPSVWIFTMKNRFKWRDKIDHEVGGKDGKPIETITREMTAEEAAAAYAREVLDND